MIGMAGMAGYEPVDNQSGIVAVHLIRSRIVGLIWYILSRSVLSVFGTPDRYIYQSPSVDLVHWTDRTSDVQYRSVHGVHAEWSGATGAVGIFNPNRTWRRTDLTLTGGHGMVILYHRSHANCTNDRRRTGGHGWLVDWIDDLLTTWPSQIFILYTYCIFIIYIHYIRNDNHCVLCVMCMYVCSSILYLLYLLYMRVVGTWRSPLYSACCTPDGDVTDWWRWINCRGQILQPGTI